MMKKSLKIMVAGIILSGAFNAAGNPILKKGDLGFLYAADPAAEVFNGKVYVYCSHDVDDDGQAYIYGNDHKVPFEESKSFAEPGKKPKSYIYGAKLKDNMVELDGPWVRLNEENVNEAVLVFKRDGKYCFHARVGDETKM